MSPTQTTAVIIAFEVLVTSIIFWKIWLNYRLKTTLLAYKIQLSKIEKEKLMLSLDSYS